MRETTSCCTRASLCRYTDKLHGYHVFASHSSRLHVSTSASASASNTSTQCLSNPISRACMLRPAGVSTCFPAPHPNGRTNLLRPERSTTANASKGVVPPPSGCSRPRRTKWLPEGVRAPTQGSSEDETGRAVGSWQRTRACSVGASVWSSGRAALQVASACVGLALLFPNY